jgi:hypothetical protein
MVHTPLGAISSRPLETSPPRRARGNRARSETTPSYGQKQVGAREGGPWLTRIATQARHDSSAKGVDDPLGPTVKTTPNRVAYKSRRMAGRSNINAGLWVIGAGGP